MIANESHIYKFLDGADKKFVIPVYQRPYSWKKQSCELLFEDLMTVYRKGYASHFFGSIVYVEHDVGYNEYTIIDGQQRITTVSLLLLAIRNYVVKNDLSIGINPKKITHAYLTDEYAEDEKKLKLKLIQGDDLAYDCLMEDKEPIVNNCVTINYNYFYRRISSLSHEELKGLYDAVMKLMIVKISLDPQLGDDPQLIFESLNSTGQDLDEADKIRNFVLMNMDSRKQSKIYKTYWEVLEKKVSDYDTNKFVRYYLATKTGELANEKKLYFAFKNYKLYNEIEIEDLLSDMLIYADFFKTIKESQVGQLGFRGILARINKLEVNSSTPLLFCLFAAKKQNQLTEEEFEQTLLIIENYVLRRIVCGLATNQINKVFVALGSEIQRYINKDGVSFFEAFKFAVLNKTGKSRFPNNSDFKDRFYSFELYNAKNTRKYFFERLENYGTKERVAVEEQIDDGTLTIEHIMPQTLTDEWKKSLGDNWELIHTKYKDTVGNLTLTAYNSDYSNLPFLKKRNMPNKGFVHSKLSLNSFAHNTDIWDESAILSRADALYEKAEKIWWYPTTSYRPNGKEEWVLWDDDFDFTNMVVSKIKVMGDELSTSNLTDALVKICSLLFDLDAVNFAKFNSRYFSIRKEDFRKPSEFAKNIYVETNLSSSAKVSLIGSLAEHFSLDSQDIQLLVKSREEKKIFKINDEDTWENITIGKLAFELIKHLISNNLIDENEIELLKTKEYSSKLFNATYYPVLSVTRESSSTGKATRYRKECVLYKNEKLYITTEWFNENRNDLIAWFKSHLN